MRQMSRPERPVRGEKWEGTQAMREGFRAELKELKAEVVSIGRLVVDQTGLSVKALVEGDLETAEQVIAGDDEIDHRTLAVEEHSLEVMATQFPVARDLRLLHSLTYIAMHMERMGDLAVNIAKAARRTADRHGPQTLYDLIHAQGNLVHRVLEARLEHAVHEVALRVDEGVEGLRTVAVGGAARGLGDVDREVAHALHVHRDVRERVQEAQVASDRELCSHDLERVLLDRQRAVIDLVVTGDDLLGGLQVALDERLDRQPCLVDDETADRYDLRLQFLQFRPEAFTHRLCAFPLLASHRPLRPGHLPHLPPFCGGPDSGHCTPTDLRRRFHRCNRSGADSAPCAEVPP